MSTEKNDLSPSVRERIRKEVEAWITAQPPHSNIGLNAFPANLGYIAGAESEHPKAIAAYREQLREKVKARMEENEAGSHYPEKYECEWFLSLLDQA